MPDFEPKFDETPGLVEEPAFILESSDGKVFNLVLGENRVGRAAINEIHLVGEKISRTHAKFIVSEGVVEVIDLGSTNGTFVNETRLEKDQAVVLNLEDEIRFGDRQLKLIQLP